jgi:hypothetical protein
LLSSAFSTPWSPTTFLRFEEAYNTSMGAARIITDAGPAYIKALGNRQGPHPLACEWVATHLAKWFGLPTFEVALLQVDADVDEIPFHRGGRAATGTAFVARAMAGHTWGGSDDELEKLVNPEAVSHLVVFDTWTRNCDRHPPDLTKRRPNYDNVFLEELAGDASGSLRLIAMDHTHCFTCGRDLNRRLRNIDRVKDQREVMIARISRLTSYPLSTNSRDRASIRATLVGGLVARMSSTGSTRPRPSR